MVFEHSTAWTEDDWEPPEVATEVPELQDLRTRIAHLRQDHNKRGSAKLDGRTIVVCHTLPYVCNYVDEDKASQLRQTTAENGKPEQSLGIRDVHKEAGTPSLLHDSTIPSDAPLPVDTTAGQITSPPSKLYNAQKPQSGGDGAKAGYFPEQAKNDQSSHRWVLTPRRDHAALNSGTKSIAEKNEVVLVAWPVEVHDAKGHRVGAGTLTSAQRNELEEGFKSLVDSNDKAGVLCVPVWMSDEIADTMYFDYCKAYLWPTFHYLGLSDHQSKERLDKAWNAYYAANLAYANKVAEVYREGDLIWVQDYHLLLVPQMLRAKFPNAAIGLFLHSPFPSSEYFRCLPQRVELLRGMLGANLCCFQTYSYGRHFLSSCVRVCGYEALEGGIGVDADGSITSVAYCPIGIDAERTERDLQKASIQPKIDALRQLYKGKKIIVGRDKLDWTKGVLPKMEAFEAFLAHYPEWQGKVVMIQVTEPAPNESTKMSSKISRYVDHINGTYGDLSFAPLHHYHQAVDRDEYLALLSVADLALVTSMRDGMNTTSMEYVLSQKERKSPLILSEFTGVTGSMKEAVRINPWDANGVARAIDACLQMSPEEKARRHAQLYKRVTTQTAAVWAHTIVLRLIESLHRHPVSEESPRLDVKILLQKFKESKKRLLMFDYDGTLTPIVKVPSAATPSDSLLKSLETLAADKRNIVYIISGRDGDFLMQHLGHIKNLGFSAEHGSFLREPGETEWKNLTEHIDMSWKNDVENIFRHLEERTPGSTVEKKLASITFHYRNSDPEWGEFQAKEAQSLLDTMAQTLPIDVIVGKKNVEVRPAHTHKGEIVKRLTYEYAEADFLICAGDDKTDEDMFRAIYTVEATVDQDDGTTLLVTPPPSLEVYPSLAKTLAAVDGETAQPEKGGIGLEDQKLPPGEQKKAPKLQPLKSNLERDSIFTIGVIPNASRNTIAKWHVDEPHEILELLEQLTTSQ